MSRILPPITVEYKRQWAENTCGVILGRALDQLDALRKRPCHRHLRDGVMLWDRMLTWLSSGLEEWRVASDCA